MARQKKDPPKTENPALPLFYRKPVPLTAAAHSGRGLSRKSDYRFAADTNAVPLYADEFLSAIRHYPIVFTDGEEPMPVAILGLGNRNQFVNDEGQWRTGCYLPAYVRRYPFIAMSGADGETFLAIDAASDRIMPLRSEATDTDVDPFYDEDENAAPVARRAIEYCERVMAQSRQTLKFVKALDDAGVLISRHARIQENHGGHRNLGGFRMVDEATLRELPDEMVAAWHRNGWMSLVNFHLASSENWRGLMEFESVGAAENV